jgi:hypothetical protein
MLPRQIVCLGARETNDSLYQSPMFDRPAISTTVSFLSRVTSPDLNKYHACPCALNFVSTALGAATSREAT